MQRFLDGWVFFYHMFFKMHFENTLIMLDQWYYAGKNNAQIFQHNLNIFLDVMGIFRQKTNIKLVFCSCTTILKISNFSNVMFEMLKI